MSLSIAYTSNKKRPAFLPAISCIPAYSSKVLYPFVRANPVLWRVRAKAVVLVDVLVDLARQALELCHLLFGQPPVLAEVPLK